MKVDIHPRLTERAQEPRYAIPAAARLVSKPETTIRRWSLGQNRNYRGSWRTDPPLIEIDGERGERQILSFLNLLELRFLASYRARVPLQAIRSALGYAAHELHHARPLLTLDFKSQGRELFLKWVEDTKEPYFVNASRRGQLAWPEALDGLFEAVEYDDRERAAFRWWPLGTDEPVIVDTRINGGQPTTAINGVRTVAIARLRREGFTIAEIREDVEASDEEINAALQLEGVGDAAAAA